MSLSSPRLLTSEAFSHPTYDMLSGELVLPQDKSGRLFYSLAGLAIQTFNRGREITAGSSEDEIDLVYTPSWASVDSITRWRQLQHKGAYTFRRLRIEVESVPQLEIHDTTEGNAHVLVVSTPDSEVSFNLDAGQYGPMGLDPVRRQIANLAYGVLAS